MMSSPVRSAPNGPALVALERSATGTPTLEDFEIRGLLGEGGFGKVLIVEHKVSSQVLALKFMRKEALVCAGTHAVEQALRERDVLIQLSHEPCPFIVNCYYAFRDEFNVYLGLEFVGGGDLFGLLQSVGRLPIKWTAFFSAELCCALEHVHRMSIVFRDLKPESVLVGMDGHMKLTDFGLATCLSRRASDGRERATSMCGTPSYMAPETMNGSSTGYSYGVDWWSLGCLIYEMIAGKQAFPDVDLSIMVLRIASARYDEQPLQHAEHAPSLVRGLLTPQPDLRLGSVHNGASRVARTHPFWSHIDFASLLAKATDPPFKPSELADGMAPLSPALQRTPDRQAQMARAMHSLDDGYASWDGAGQLGGPHVISGAALLSPGGMRRTWSSDELADRARQQAGTAGTVPCRRGSKGDEGGSFGSFGASVSLPPAASDPLPPAGAPDIISVWDWTQPTPPDSRRTSEHAGLTPPRLSAADMEEASAAPMVSDADVVEADECPPAPLMAGMAGVAGVAGMAGVAGVAGGAGVAGWRTSNLIRTWSRASVLGSRHGSRHGSLQGSRHGSRQGSKAGSHGPYAGSSSPLGAMPPGAPGTSGIYGALPGEAWSADSVATPLDMQRELAPALRRWCERYLILYGKLPTRDAALAQLDVIISDVIPVISSHEAERFAATYLELQNSV